MTFIINCMMLVALYFESLVLAVWLTRLTSNWLGYATKCSSEHMPATAAVVVSFLFGLTVALIDYSDDGLHVNLIIRASLAVGVFFVPVTMLAVKSTSFLIRGTTVFADRISACIDRLVLRGL